MKRPNALPFGLEKEELNRRLEQRLDDLAKKTKFYLRKDISLKEIAAALVTNRTYASRMINEVKGCKFNDYVNQLRIGGMERWDALVATGKTRMRPILMTALTTILAIKKMK